MPDWEGLVQQRLGRLHLDPQVARDIVRELAGHLQDHYEAALAAGAPEPQAFSGALGQIGSGCTLARNIRNAREDMFTTTPFKRRVLWPGMVALVLSGLSFLFIYGLGYKGHEKMFNVVWFNESAAMVFYLPWLIALPFVGAVGAWLARRNGGTAAHRILAATSPALLNLGIFVVLFAVAVPVDLFLRHATSFSLMLIAFCVYMVPWVITPAACGLLGAAPFLFGKSRDQQPVSHSAAHA